MPLRADNIVSFNNPVVVRLKKSINLVNIKPREVWTFDCSLSGSPALSVSSEVHVLQYQIVFSKYHKKLPGYSDMEGFINDRWSNYDHRKINIRTSSSKLIRTMSCHWDVPSLSNFRTHTRSGGFHLSRITCE